MDVEGAPLPRLEADSHTRTWSFSNRQVVPTWSFCRRPGELIGELGRVVFPVLLHGGSVYDALTGSSARPGRRRRCQVCWTRIRAALRRVVAWRTQATASVAETFRVS